MCNESNNVMAVTSNKFMITCTQKSLKHRPPFRLVILSSTQFGIPTNSASVHLVMGCPNARAGVKIVKTRTLRAT